MGTKLQIEKFGDENNLPLHIEHQGQDGPAYLYLDTRDGEVYCAAKHPACANSWGVDEHNGHVRRWRVPNNLTAQGYNDMLSEEKLLSLLERVYDGAEEYYDGNNYRTRLSDDAVEAEEEVEKFTSEINQWGVDYAYLDVWDANMWFQDARYADLVKGKESHEEAAIRLQKTARSENVYLSLINIEKALAKLQQDESSE